MILMIDVRLLQVVQKMTPLPENGLIAVNGWSIGGVYGHMVLEGFKKPKTDSSVAEDSIPRLVPLTARTEDFMPRLISLVKLKIK